MNKYVHILPYTDLSSGTIANMAIGVLLIVIIVNVIVMLIVVCIRYKKKGALTLIHYSLHECVYTTMF